MDKEKDTKDPKKIAVGKTKNQIIINPPEKLPAKNVNELFKGARTKHAVVLEKKIELVLQAKAEAADLPEETLQQVFIRGYKSLPLNTTLTREQYAMNRVNSFVAGGQAMVEDCDLLPIMERMFRTGQKGTGGAMRPHIKREKNPYNGKTTFHIVDAKGVVKHSTADELEAKKHLATKYNSYLGEANGLWANIHAKRERIKRGSGEHMRKPGSEGAPTAADLKRSAVKEENEVVEATSAAIRMQRALDKIKADRERKERLAAPYVNSVFAKKVEDKKKDVKEEILKEYEMSDKEYARTSELNGPRAAKLLKHSYASHAAGEKEKGSRAHKLFLKAKERHLKNPENAEKHRKAMMAGAADYYASKKPGQYTGD